LAGVLKRPAILPVPSFAARLAFGELADEGILASARVVPKKLLESGFEFKYRELRPALETLLKNV
jgi:NAD dependent epimerase/dehydratase family enzyme